MECGEVAQFYRGESLLVTGASGFMGKVLLEKLLIACPGVRTIFILIRPKRGKSIETRMDEMFNLPLFQRVREKRPEAWHKVVPLVGDVLEEKLGLSDEVRRRLQAEVSVVIHSAATLRLEARLKDAIQMNVLGTQKVLELAKTMLNLKAFIYISTAFCHVDVPIMEEKIYKTPISPVDIITMCSWMDEQALEIITPKIIHPHPNCYTYSKRLAEALVDSYFPELPVCIVRPSIVTPSYKEPVPGWVDNLNGPTGILLAGGKGVIRSMLCHGELNAEIVPVDLAINIIIIITSKIGSMKQRPKEVPVYNVTQGESKVISWNNILEKGKRIVWEYPFSLMLWYPDGTIRSNKFIHKLYIVFTHWLPAYLIDGLLFVFGQQRFMIHVQTKVANGLEVLQYFTTRQWNFRNDKVFKLREEMKGSDKEIFAFPFEEIGVELYIKDCVLGCRQYIVKEDPVTLPSARRTLTMLWLLDRFISLLFYLLLVWMIVSYSDTIRGALDSIPTFSIFHPTVKKTSVNSL